MKNAQIMVTLVMIILLCLLSCGGGFEEQSPDSEDIINSIMGVDSL